MTVTFTGVDNLRRRLTAVGKTPEGVLQKWQLDTEAKAKTILSQKVNPRKTGNLERSIRRGTITRSYAIVRAGANYAAYVELGTGPHVIRPKRAKLLAWPATAGGRRATGAGNARARAGNVRPSGINTGRSSIGPNSGTYRYARIVHHPGTKPKPYLQPAAEQALDAITADLITDAWNGAA